MVVRRKFRSLSIPSPALSDGRGPFGCSFAGVSRTNEISTISPMTANAAETAKIGPGTMPICVSSRNVTSGPSRAPTVSMLRCTPNAAPSRSSGVAIEIIASRGAVRMPLPARSAAISAPMPNGEPPTSGKNTFVAADRP
jgi:hypothetical protein